MSHERILKFIAKHDLFNAVFWTEDLEFQIICNDIFVWGSADCEELTEYTLDDLEAAINVVGTHDGCFLYCAMRRGMRPQGAAYSCFNEKNWNRFDLCGPVREVGLGNPEERPFPINTRPKEAK